MDTLSPRQNTGTTSRLQLSGGDIAAAAAINMELGEIIKNPDGSFDYG
jgi:hypothetical protein